MAKWWQLAVTIAVILALGACGENGDDTDRGDDDAARVAPRSTVSDLAAITTPRVPAGTPGAAGTRPASSGEQATSTPGQPTRTADTTRPIVTATTPGDDPPEPSSTTDEVSELEQTLLDALLSSDDLGVGWTEDDTEIQTDEISEDTDTLCGAAPFPDRAAKLAQVERQLSNGDIDQIVLENITAFPEPIARDAMEYARSAAECSSWTDPDDGTEYTLEPLAQEPSLGDDAFGVHVAFTTSGTVVEGDWVFVRVGGLIAIVAYFGAEGADFSAMTDVLVTVEDQLQQAAAAAGITGDGGTDVAALERLLLSTTDLPEGWTEVDRGQTADPDRYGVCQAEAFPDVFGAVAEVQVDFEVDEESGPFLWHSLVLMHEGDAAAAMQFIRENTACNGWEEGEFVFDLTDIDDPALGDDSVAVIVGLEGEIDGEMRRIEVEFLFTQVDDVISVVLYAEQDGIDLAVAAELQALAVARLESELGT